MKNSWEIVFATREPPLPFGMDTAARTVFGMMKALRARGVAIRCLTLASRPRELEEARRLLPQALAVPVEGYEAANPRSWIGRVWQGLRRPLAKGLPQAMQRKVSELLRRDDILLQTELIPMGWLAQGHPRAILSVHHLKLLDDRGVPPSSWREWKSIRQSWRAEQMVVRRYRWIRVTTPPLAEAVRTLNPKAHIAVIPITLDLDQYRPIATPTSQPVVGLLGTMGWRPSREAAVRLLKRLWPRIKARVPEARLALGGWQARRWLTPYLDGQEDVVIAEDVPHPRPFFERLAVMVYPTPQGSGMKVKVLEAMAYGVPVVTTPDGAEGLAVTAGVEAAVSNEDEALAEATVTLLREPARRQAMRQAAWRLLARCVHPSIISERSLAFYQAVGGTS